MSRVPNPRNEKCETSLSQKPVFDGSPRVLCACTSDATDDSQKFRSLSTNLGGQRTSLAGSSIGNHLNKVRAGTK
jgi:hypothetical protein